MYKDAKPKNVTYYGKKGGYVFVQREDEDAYELPLKPSLEIENHSPTGFAWGYGGSGPAQLALAILLDYTGDDKLSHKLYQDFKWAVVAGWTQNKDWSLEARDIEVFLGPERIEAIANREKSEQ